MTRCRFDGERERACHFRSKTLQQSYFFQKLTIQWGVSRAAPTRIFNILPLLPSKKAPKNGHPPPMRKVLQFPELSFVPHNKSRTNFLIRQKSSKCNFSEVDSWNSTRVGKANTPAFLFFLCSDCRESTTDDTDDAEDQVANLYGREGNDCAARYLCSVNCMYDPTTRTCDRVNCGLPPRNGSEPRLPCLNW